VIKGVFIGALMGLLWRLAMILPADLYAQLLGSPETIPTPGSVQAWLTTPLADRHFLRLFVLSTWWIGPLAGVILVWQSGGRWTDLICALLAGAITGMAGSATLACLLVVGDMAPRLLLSIPLRGSTLGPVVGTPLWILTAVVCWLILGAVLGFVFGILGRPGAAVLALVASPLSWMLRTIGLVRMADFFALRGS
jgi:hypothetical protein